MVRFRLTHARVIESEKGVPLLGGITENAEPPRSGAFLLLAAKIQSHLVGTNKSLPIENRRLLAAVLQKCDAGQNEDHGNVAKRMNLVAHEEDTY